MLTPTRGIGTALITWALAHLSLSALPVWIVVRLPPHELLFSFSLRSPIFVKSFDLLSPVMYPFVCLAWPYSLTPWTYLVAR